MTHNISSPHGLRDSRAGHEPTLAVNQALKAATELRWVKAWLNLVIPSPSVGRERLYSSSARSSAGGYEKFEAGKKVHKRAMEQKLREMQEAYVASLRTLAEKNNWP